MLKKKYPLIMVLAFMVIAASVMFVHLYSHEKTKEIFLDETEKVILLLKKDFLSDTVNNLIMEIDSLREQKEVVYQLNTDARQRRFVEEYYVSEEEFASFYENRFRGDQNQDLWTAVLINEETDELLYASEHLEGDTPTEVVEELEETLLSKGEVRKGSLRGIFGVSITYVENQVKEEVAASIRNRRFSNESYIWVNEVLNFEGGDQYAIRRVHPNLPETEGTYLSTHTEDLAGNRPYEEELQGVKENGEHFFNYYFKKLNSEEIGEKITYAKLYEDFDWIIAMGVHVDEVHAYTEKVTGEIEGLTSESVFQILGILLVILLSGLFLIQVLEKARMMENQKTLLNEVNRDLLTGAETRRSGTKHLEKLFQEYQRSPGSTAVMMVDIDRFKNINDTYGHDIGDEVLKKVTRTIHHMIRNTDHLIRWGGDEFVAVFPGMKEEYLREFGEKISLEVEKIRIESSEKPLKVTLSMGLTVFRSEDRSYEDALKRADLALYESKNLGRNQVSVF
ncbi:sensor domain-containing diguanylate cyclase [Proteiniclasticum ruminis]|uniref:Diguanylate cyclase (GGDEF) domain-containing protein n=1 Tax=Proteiniclasticum ruminis TaxID=398199 RepID=A0A1I4XLU1_9CLOT|nr:sensor domain-containing diguanylate cyclase [Proteiniclasticum ruminis]SFN26606.1 diguanylate cyclase (GGDEF) domain-containing protein [Proteiniclasticum ruminis]